MEEYNLIDPAAVMQAALGRIDAESLLGGLEDMWNGDAASAPDWVRGALETTTHYLWANLAILPNKRFVKATATIDPRVDDAFDLPLGKDIIPEGSYGVVLWDGIDDLGDTFVYAAWVSVDGAYIGEVLAFDGEYEYAIRPKTPQLGLFGATARYKPTNQFVWILANGSSERFAHVAFHGQEVGLVPYNLLEPIKILKRSDA